MGRYAELCIDYAESQKRHSDFFDAMYEQVQQFASGLAEYLEVPVQGTPTSPGMPNQYVTLLRAEEDRPLERSSDLFPLGQDLRAWFRVGILLECGLGTLPKEQYVVRVGLRWLHDFMEVTFPEIPHTERCYRHLHRADYQSAYRIILSAIEAKLRFDPFHPT
ncbi:MAG: hypothetical protein WCA24_01985 [Thiomonas sp.]